MKKCLLAAHNLKYMFDKGNRVFFIVLISMSLSVFGMLFFAGYFLYSYYESEAGSKIVVIADEPIGSLDKSNAGRFVNFRTVLFRQH